MKHFDFKHFIEYSVLVVGLFIFMALLSMFKGNTQALLLTSLGSSVFYVVWGIIHHAVEKRLQREVVLEYVTIGMFIFFLLSAVIIY